ncbi:uncharacterized protein LOC142814769 [Rhipicephalus microplus]|uniref:uncharacterized protein LOC142814769 n=1 Tax=Rhipicephalus microplus TaxID=6941 RepID=UPI003F6B8584
MSQDSPRNTRKRYLDRDEPFVLPRSTAFWKKQRERSGPCDPRYDAEVSADAQASSGHPSPSTSEPALTADGADDALSRGDNVGLDPEDVRSSQADRYFDDDTVCEHAETDNGACTESVEETQLHEPLMDDIFSDCSDCSENDGDTEASNKSEEALPTFLDESELLAADFALLDSHTLPGSTTSKAAAVVMIMAFVITHGLIWVALGDLLSLIDGLFGFKGNTLPRTKHLFRKMWSSRTRSLVKHFFYCDVCGSLLNSQTGASTMRCPTCSVDSDVSALKAKGNVFIILDLKEQVKSLIARSKDDLFKRLIQLNEGSNETSVALDDITDGAILRKLRRSGTSGSMDLTLTFNTDGSPIFKLSTSSIWPIEFLINELPPECRMKNCLVAGLWFGRHPDMSLFMGKFVEEVNNFGHLIWNTASSVIRSTIHAVCCCVDAPARAAVNSMVQFNGLFGCPWCYACGEHHEGRQRYTNVVADELRTPKGMMRDMKFAIEVGELVNGLKGPSPLARLKGFDLVLGQTVDYMHCVLLGVTKCFAEA